MKLTTLLLTLLLATPSSGSLPALPAETSQSGASQVQTDSGTPPRDDADSGVGRPSLGAPGRRRSQQARLVGSLAAPPRIPAIAWVLGAAVVAAVVIALLLATPSEASPTSALRGAPHVASQVWGAPPPTAPMGAIPKGVKPMSATSLRDGRTGTISHMGQGFPADYLALPIGPGHRVKVCGPVGCVTATSTDAGPNRAMLQAGRIADLSVAYFRRVCGPESMGVCRGSWHVVGAAPEPTLPATDTAP